MEAQHNLSKVLKQIEEGQAVYITRRKEVVAKILPPDEEAKLKFPDFASRAKRAWGEKWNGRSSDALLDETRGER